MPLAIAGPLPFMTPPIGYRGDRGAIIGGWRHKNKNAIDAAVSSGTWCLVKAGLVHCQNGNANPVKCQNIKINLTKPNLNKLSKSNLNKLDSMFSHLINTNSIHKRRNSKG